MTHTDSKVDDRAEQARCEDREWKLRHNLSPEVRGAAVHIVVHFTQEHRSFVREDKDNVLDGVEGDVHADEEESSLEILDSLSSLGSVPEEQNGEEGCKSRGDDLDIGSLR